MEAVERRHQFRALLPLEELEVGRVPPVNEFLVREFRYRLSGVRRLEESSSAVHAPTPSYYEYEVRGEETRL